MNSVKKTVKLEHANAPTGRALAR